jgi:hypothetical protein
MRIGYGRFVLLALFLLAARGHCAASDMCPWITQGSAAKLLDGDVTVSIHGDDKQGSCSFRGDGKVAYTLEVSVTAHEDGACRKGSAELKGIGNEAYLCSVKQSSFGWVEKVSSRVRDTFFTVTLSATGGRASSMPEEVRRNILDQAAEQVAGNLF